MQPSEGYQYDGGPPNTAHGHQIPAGSRLNQYLANNNRQGPSFGPGTPINVNAPVFVPKHQQPQPTPPPPPPPMANQFAQLSIHDVPVQMIPFGQISSGPPSFQQQLPHMSHRPPQHQQGAPPLSIPSIHHQQQPYDRYQHESRGGTTYFYHEPQAEGPPEEEQYNPQEGQDGYIVVFISSELKAELLNRQLAYDTKPDPSAYPDIPQTVEHYSSLVPLESINLQNQSHSTYKGFSCRDGNYYCLRRIHGNRIQHPGKQTHLVEQWKKLSHGNIVPLREVLINCRAFDDSSLVFAYDYYPLAETLMVKHFEVKPATFYDPNNAFRITSPMANSVVLHGAGGANETLIWSYIIQIAAALRSIHSSGLACRTLDLNKVITYGNKIMLSFCGVQDVIDPDSTPIQQQQNEDLNMFGNLIVALATGRANGYRKDLYPGSKKFIEDNFSMDLRNVIGFLHNNGTRKTINEIMPMIGGRFFTVMESMQSKSDLMEAELSKELENGRLFRLIAKMNTVLERVEYGADEKWSETGDRFMLKLFRDYVFHQVTDQGKAWLDMAHIVQCLNKLDCGSTEKIEMVSRCGDTQIIIDYATLKRCLEKSFRELVGNNMIHR
uniref:PAN2-PAN3 deadenylation complex subunit PAN3 n=1 Tax=Caenorhabditis tropicalis TaxID=1561998 RepID=A0A1I7UHN0_9PELO